jgi:hypothetical protein
VWKAVTEKRLPKRRLLDDELLLLGCVLGAHSDLECLDSVATIPLRPLMIGVWRQRRQQKKKQHHLFLLGDRLHHSHQSCQRSLK